MKKLFGGFATQAELDREWDVENAVPDFPAYVQKFLDESAAARARLKPRLDVPYGPTLAECCNVFPAKNANAPILLFIHGGFWKALTAHEFDRIATGPVEAGYAVVNVTHALCPIVTMTEIVRQIRAALAWTYRNARTFNGDPDRIYVSGHSAGGHLAAMAMLTDWEDDYGLPADVIKGGIPISGAFDLRPFPHCFAQPQLRLTAGEVERCSPLFHIRPMKTPLVVAWGTAEGLAFQQQSGNFLAAWTTAGNHGRALLIDGANHFEVMDGFTTADGLMTRALEELRHSAEHSA
jgi:arylformamidase